MSAGRNRNSKTVLRKSQRAKAGQRRAERKQMLRIKRKEKRSTWK